MDQKHLVRLPMVRLLSGHGKDHRWSNRQWLVSYERKSILDYLKIKIES